MPHVDEGQLHAWLDGAFQVGDPELLALRTHVQDCADCRNRLDEAQTLRARAGDILALAVPALVEPPAFELIAARAPQQSTQPPRWRLPGPARLAWAATVVIALGMGWLARDLIPFAEKGAPAFSSPEREEAASAVSQDAVALPPPPSPAPASPPVVASEMGTTSGARDSDASRQANAPQAEPPARASATLDEVRRAGDGAAAGRVIGRIGSDSAGIQAKQVAGAVALQEVVVTGAAVAAPVALSAATPPEWQTTTMEQARRTYGNVVFVPGLEISNVSSARSGDRVLVRVTQALPDKAALELLQSFPAADLAKNRLERARMDQREEAQLAQKRAPADAQKGAAVAAKPMAFADATGATTVTIERSGVTITASAPVSADSLRALLARIK